MTTLRFTQENWPVPEEFQQRLKDALEKSNPVDDLLELAEELREYEQKYNMTSEEFYKRFQRGELGDAMDFMDWAGAYDLFLDRKYDNAPHHPELPNFPYHVHIEDRVEPADPPDLHDILRKIDGYLYGSG